MLLTSNLPQFGRASQVTEATEGHKTRSSPVAGQAGRPRSDTQQDTAKEPGRRRNISHGSRGCASLPEIRVTAGLPGLDPRTVASVLAPVGEVRPLDLYAVEQVQPLPPDHVKLRRWCQLVETSGHPGIASAGTSSLGESEFGPRLCQRDPRPAALVVIDRAVRL